MLKPQHNKYFLAILSVFWNEYLIDYDEEKVEINAFDWSAAHK